MAFILCWVHLLLYLGKGLLVQLACPFATHPFSHSVSPLATSDEQTSAPLPVRPSHVLWRANQECGRSCVPFLPRSATGRIGHWCFYSFLCTFTPSPSHSCFSEKQSAGNLKQRTEAASGYRTRKNTNMQESH